MSQIKVSMLINANGTAAKAEVDGLIGSTKKLSAASDDVGARWRSAASAQRVFGQSAATADTQVTALKAEMVGLTATIDALTAAEGRAVTKSKEMAEKIAALEARLGRGGRGGGGTGAAGSMGNLVAQFNDLGVMMAAGQNPLQLAIQQGTQITQVIGPMGAGGAVKALGGALLGMLNPINIVTIGAIALGAALIQWLFSASADAKSFDDAMGEIEASIQTLNDLSNAFSADGLQSLEDKYGAVTDEVRNLIEAQREFAIAQTRAAATAAVSDLTGEYGYLLEAMSEGGRGGVQAQLHVQRELGITLQQAIALRNAFDQAKSATSLEDQIRALSAIRAIIEQSSIATSDYAGKLLTAETNLMQLSAAQQSQIGPATAALRDQVAAQQNLNQLAAEEAVKRATNRLAADAAAQSMIADLNSQADLNAIIATYGTDSAQAIQAQAAAARDVAVELINASDASAELKAQAIAAYDAANAIAATNVAAPLSAGADQAGRIADNLLAALSFAQQIAMVQAATPAAPPALGFGLGDAPSGGTGTTLGFGNNRGSNFNSPPRTFGGARSAAGGGGGGGAASVREERDAVAELIARLQAEADVRAELDPVQQEMLRHREDLTGATTAQRAQVEALIAAEQREAASAQMVQESWGFLKDTAYDALLAMAKGGDSASDSLRNLGASLAEAAFQAAIMGEGPLGGLFGGTSIFSLIGGALGIGGAGGGIRGHAQGGYITGPGDGTSDSILMYGSSGEMMMNARAVRQNRHVLEAMNANAPVPRFATGGLIGAGRVAGTVGSASGQPVVVQMTIDVTGSRGNSEIMEMVRAGVEQGMAYYDRSILPASVNRISTDARRIG